MADLNTRISDFLWKNLSEKHVTGKKDPFWESFEGLVLNFGSIPVIWMKPKQTGRLR